MTRKLALAVLAFATWAALARGDIVYLNNGKVYRGQVTRKEDKVLIKMALGTIAVNASDVQRIIKTAAATQPDTPTSPTPPTDRQKLGLERFTRPESHVFLYMRQLATTPSGMASYRLREKIKEWRIRTHDRERRLEGRWISPEETSRHRREFAELLKKTQDTVRQLRRITYSSSLDADAQRVRYKRKLAGELRRAAQVWPDPILRDFLTGMAYLEGLYYSRALKHFRNCREAAPRVAGFWQGEGVALAGAGEKLKALAAYMEALRLRPDSRDAIELVRRGMKETPGAKMGEPTYIAARDLTDLYEEPSGRYYTRRGVTWLMPGRDWLGREHALPTPTYDRLVFRQAVGVPISKTTLLVDGVAVKEALEVFVILGDGMVVPGRFRPSSTYGRGKAPIRLDLVTVADCVFTPLATDEKAKATAGQQVTAYGLSLYEEMGSRVRPIPTKIEKVEANGAIRLAQGLIAGESAGPIITKDGRLLGFLAGKTDATADGGGPDQVIGLTEIADLIKRAGRSSSYGGYRRVKRKITPKPAQGRCFVVLATAAEAPERKRR